MLELRGTEAVTIELGGTLAPAAVAPVLRDSGLGAEQDGDGVRVSLLLFRMQGLHLRGLPRPAFHYGEALWRVGVRHRDRLAWLAVACDLDSAWIRWSGARLCRYPVRRARFVFAAEAHTHQVALDGDWGGLAVRATCGTHQPPPEPPRPLLVYAAARLYRIPWNEEPAPYRRVADLQSCTGTGIAETFHGPVSWQPTALVHHGRIHRCGVAGRA